MSTYDDIIEQNKRSLTQAQIAALAQAAQQYSIENAGNRAGALASARQQYDTGYRGLQNMGLAGANGAQPTSGEVPRLKTEIQTPFDQYNQRLKSVERQRVAALSGNMVYQNQLAAEEARRRALAEEEARRQAAARETDQARFQRAQAVANAINRNRTFGKVTAADLSVPSRKEYEASTTPPEVQAFNQASVKAANAVTGVANTFPSVMVRAAAAMVGLQDPYSAINTAQQNEQLGAVKDAYQKADATLRGMDQTRKYGGTVDEKQYQATKRTRDEAKAVYDAEKARREADTYRREAEKIQQQDPEYYDAIVTANNAKATPESRKSASRVIAARSVNDIVQGMGFTKTMTDKEYDDAKKVIPDVRMQLNIIDSTRNRQANGGTGGDDVIGEALAELKKMGYSEDSARELVKKFETDRNYNREYTYLIDAYTALQEHYGDKPEQGVNKNEKDYTYRMVNGLDTGTFTGTMGDALMSMWRDDKKIIGKDTTKYMTDAQRDAYNAIYEKDGIKAANEYIKDILPLIETQRAAEDQKWLEEMASKDRGGLSWLYANTQNPAWLLARATNLIGSIPAMAEKLAVNARNLAAGATGELKKYSPDSSISRISNWSDIIQAQQSKNILEHYESKNQPGIGKFVNFMYNTGTSMADSMIAMGVSGAMGSWATDALFFSSAGNQAYKDAIERGGTQEQAMGVAFASGLAEALFEHLSLEKLTQTLQFKGKTLTRAVKDMLTQAGVEGSEELFTELSNVLTDFAIMKDKSEMQQAINSGELGRFLWDRLSSATLGGLASGFLFGVAGFGGAVIDARADSKTKNALGTRVRENGDVQQVRDTAILLGGEAAQQAEKVQKRETNANVGEMTATVVQQVQSLGEGLSMDQQVAAERIIDGAQMTAEEASNVYELLGKETVEKMNYDGTSAEAFQKSYNDRVQKNGVLSKEERRANAEEFRSKKKKQEAAERLWKDPNLGYTVTKDGQRVKNMPGDLTAVSYEDQQKSNFAARTTAKVGKATYEIAGMEAREGMTDEQKIAALKKNMNKSQVARAEFVESLANALGVDMVIHDDMGLANGYIDNDGKIHFSLSSKQSILRVASHELTHKIREVSEEHFTAIKDAIIKQVGEDTFNKRVEQKKQEYEEAGVKLDPDLAIEETVTEYSEKMLQDTDFLEDFVDENPEAAKTLKGELLKILNTVKRAFKRTENRNYGQSFSNEIEYTRDTLQAMYNGLEAVMERAQNPESKAEQQAQREESVAQEEKAEQAANEPTETAKREPANDSPAVAAIRRQIERLKKAGDTAKAAELEQKLAQWQETTQKASESDGLYMTEESRKAEEVKKAVEESAQKKTYVPGYTAKEVEKVLSVGVFGDRSNYEGNDYENARGMIAQLIPDIVKVLQEDPSVDLFDVNDRTRAAVGEMLKNYFEDDGDMTALREAIPSVIGVDTTAKGDLKSKDQSLFQMSAKLSKALGKKVTLVSETNAKGQRNASYKTAEKLEEVWERVRDQFGLSDEQDFSVDLPRLLEFIEKQSDTRRKASDLFNVQEAIDDTAINLFDAVKEMLQEKTGKRYSLDTDDLRENVKAFTKIDAEAFKAGLEQLKNVTPGKGLFALKDISRFLDTISGGDKELRDTLNKVFEKPHSQALKNYATGVEKMQQRVLDIGQRAGVCDAKGRHFDAKKSAAIQNIGEGYSNRQTDVTVRVVDADAVRVTATDKETGKSLGTKDYTFRELKRAYGREVASTLWSQAFDASEKAGKHVDIEREVNTQPYTIEDLQNAYPDDWQKLKAAADEFRSMYDEYIQSINQMLEQIYPYASKYAAVDKITEAIEKKQAKLDTHKEAEQNRIAELNKKLGAKEAEMAAKKRTDTKAYRNLWEQVENLKAQIQEAEADLKEYEASVKDELTVMGEEKAVLQNAEQEGDSLSRMHRLEYREDYFHHFQEMASGVQNLKAIFTNNTDISPAVVGKSDQTKPKSRFAGFFQHRTGSNYTADALKGMLRYGQLAEYKLAFDPLSAYLRNAIEDVKKLDPNATNRDNLIRYLRQWTNAILGKSHDVDRAIVDSGFGMRSKVFKTLDWINSRVIQNTLLWNMRSALLQISNVTNAKSIVTNNLDWAKGLWKWALAARGNEQMRAIMSQSTFLASRYMDDLQLTPGAFKTPRQFAAWLLGALDEVSAKATWWAAHTQYQRNPNAKVIRNAYRSYDNAIDYADDVTRRTHAGRGVGELAPAMTSKMINLVAPFQVEVNNTYQLLKDNVKRGNYLGILSTGVSVFLLNTLFEAIVGSTPLGFDFIRAIIDICFGIAGDDPDDDKDDYGVKQVAQRLAGEFVGGLPYANLIAGAIGDDNAKKIFGEDTDMTRYGHTQIGINALMNTVNGLSDIASAIKDGKNLFTQTNFISDIDDLLNLTLPMGGKQLSRTAEGIKTVAQGYASKVNNKGEEQVQFATEQDLLHYLHAGLFGKWALTEASEYFGEERLLPKLFGAYEGPKSTAGTPVDAKEYKAALATGISGKDYFTLRYDLKKYTTQAGKRAEMMEQNLTPEQKAQLDALMIQAKNVETKDDGSVVYQKSSKGEWTVKADYSSREWLRASDLPGDRYEQAREAAKIGMQPQTFVDIYEKWNGMSGNKKQQAKEYLDSLHLPKKQYDYIWTQVFKYKAE